MRHTRRKARPSQYDVALEAVYGNENMVEIHRRSHGVISRPIPGGNCRRLLSLPPAPDRIRLVCTDRSPRHMDRRAMGISGGLSAHLALDQLSVHTTGTAGDR